jgi:hypothetical protein
MRVLAVATTFDEGVQLAAADYVTGSLADVTFSAATESPDSRVTLELVVSG